MYRIRELSREPLPLAQLRFSNEREAKADKFVNAKLVKVETQERIAEGVRIAGSVLDNAVKYQASIVIDDDQRLRDAGCECFFWQQNRLRKGPCEHMLALSQGRAETAARVTILLSRTLTVAWPGYLAYRTVDRRPCKLTSHASLARSSLGRGSRGMRVAE